MKNWNKYTEGKPSLGTEVIAQNDKWKSEYNPKGIRIGFQNLSDGDDGEFLSARYNNSQDSWITDTEQLPTYWKSTE